VTVPEDGEVALLGAGQLLGLVVGDEVRALSAADGAVRHTLPVSGEDAPQQLSSEGVAMFLVDGTLHVLDAPSGAVRWQADARGLPTAPVPGSAGDGVLLVPDEDGFSHRDPRSGEEVGRSSADDVPAGGTASGVGPVIVHRLPDRVLVYR
jgi:hypothetical protein